MAVRIVLSASGWRGTVAVKKRRSPQDQKRLSYSKDRRNWYGENDKSPARTSRAGNGRGFAWTGGAGVSSSLPRRARSMSGRGSVWRARGRASGARSPTSSSVCTWLRPGQAGPQGRVDGKRRADPDREHPPQHGAGWHSAPRVAVVALRRARLIRQHHRRHVRQGRAGYLPLGTSSTRDRRHERMTGPARPASEPEAS